MEPTYSFYMWIFDYYHDENEGNHGRLYDLYEYGISSANMMIEYPQESVEDGKAFFDSQEREGKMMLLNGYYRYCQGEVERLEAEMRQIGKLI